MPVVEADGERARDGNLRSLCLLRSLDFSPEGRGDNEDVADNARTLARVDDPELFDVVWVRRRLEVGVVERLPERGVLAIQVVVQNPDDRLVVRRHLDAGDDSQRRGEPAEE